MIRFLSAFVLAISPLVSRAGEPFDEKAEKGFVESLGDPASKAGRAKLVEATAKPATITRLFRTADYTNDPALKKRAEAVITVWLNTKPELKAAQIDKLAEDRQVSRLLASLLEHKHRLNPWCKDSWNNRAIAPAKPVPADADIEPSDLFTRLLGHGLLGAVEPARTLKLGFQGELPTNLDKTPHKAVGWDVGEAADLTTLGHHVSIKRTDPYGRNGAHDGYYACFERHDPTDLVGVNAPIGVFGRGPVLSKRMQSRIERLILVEGDFHINDLSGTTVWVNGDLIPRWYEGALPTVSIDRSLIVCTGAAQLNRMKLSLWKSVLVLGEKLSDDARARIELREGSVILDGESNLFKAFKPSSSADYGCESAIEGKYTVAKKVKDVSPLGKAGLKAEDLVIRVNGFEIKSALGFGRELCRAEMGKGAAVLQVERGKETHFLYVDLSTR